MHAVAAAEFAKSVAWADADDVHQPHACLLSMPLPARAAAGSRTRGGSRGNGKEGRPPSPAGRRSTLGAAANKRAQKHRHAMTMFYFWTINTVVNSSLIGQYSRIRARPCVRTFDTMKQLTTNDTAAVCVAGVSLSCVWRRSLTQPCVCCRSLTQLCVL